MAKSDIEQQSNQVNLTVVALVALVAIVGVVALVLYTANVATGMGQAAAAEDENVAGGATKQMVAYNQDVYNSGSGGARACSANADCGLVQRCKCLDGANWGCSQKFCS